MEQSSGGSQSVEIFISLFDIRRGKSFYMRAQRINPYIHTVFVNALKTAPLFNVVSVTACQWPLPWSFPTICHIHKTLAPSSGFKHTVLFTWNLLTFSVSTDTDQRRISFTRRHCFTNFTPSVRDVLQQFVILRIVVKLALSFFQIPFSQHINPPTLFSVFHLLVFENTSLSKFFAHFLPPHPGKLSIKSHCTSSVSLKQWQTVNCTKYSQSLILCIHSSISTYFFP